MAACCSPSPCVSAPPPAVPTVPPHFQPQPVHPADVCVPVIPPAIATCQPPYPPVQKIVIQGQQQDPCLDYVKAPPPAIPVVPPCFQPVQVPPTDVCVPVVPPAAPIITPQPKVCKYIQPARPQSFAPRTRYEKPCTTIDDSTIYRKSYLPVASEILPKCVPLGNLCVGEGKFTNNTVHKMSYLPVDNHLKLCPIMPCHHKLIGDGPMQEVTTNRHDYVPKCVNKVKPFKHPVNLVPSECPLEDNTINRMSYRPVQCPQRALPFYPKPELGVPKGKFTGKTVHNMSYQPVETKVQEDFPWARKTKYAPPQLRMDGKSVQSMSFQPPGIYVECSPNDPNAIPCGTDEPPQPFIAHYPGDQVAPCPIPCPKAAC